MTAGQQRRVQRAVHLAAALLLVAYVYAPLEAQLQDAVRYIVLPALVVTGIAMWQAPRIRRLRSPGNGRLPGAQPTNQPVKCPPRQGGTPLARRTLARVRVVASSPVGLLVRRTWRLLRGSGLRSLVALRPRARDNHAAKRNATAAPG